MSNLVINANSIYNPVIRIGRQTENLVSEITFNVNMWFDEYGAGECVLNVRRNGDANAYPVPMTIVDGMTTWTITDTDTARKGRGEIQLKYTVGEKVKTSPIFTISCGESLIGDGEPPSGYEDWLTELNRMTSEVEAAKTSASASAQTAQTAAGTATEKASEAEQSANTASGFAVNASASAQSASVSAQAAAQSAEQAASSASDVEASAQAASQSAQSAESAKQSAQTAESNAQGFAQTASAKASEAAESVAQAQESVTDAQSEVAKAKAEADRAKTYADRAAEVELEIPTNVSQLENDAGYLTEHQSLADYVRKDVLYNMLPTDSASGAVASFPDGADDIPLKSLVVDIESVQDLHGYDSPWPAGGGKNLIPYPYTDGNSKTINGVTFTVDEYGVITANGTATANAEFVLINPYASINLPSGSYMLSGLPSGAGSSSFVFNTYAGHSTGSDLWDVRTSGRQLNASDSISRMNISVRIVSGYTANNLVIKPQFESGTTATDYEPYSNICPISGWTGMTVNVNGTEITISWESEAGTIYGGTLDVVNGVLTVTKGFIQSYSGETLPSAWISDRDMYADGTTPTTGAEVCYDLATPVTYQLTPTEVRSLFGVNSIFADTGDTTVEYRADTSAYIAKKIAEAISALS